MNNKQRAAARRAINSFPGLRPDLTQDENGNDVVTPYRVSNPDLRGAGVTVADGMPEREIETALRRSCAAVPNG